MRKLLCLVAGLLLCWSLAAEVPLLRVGVMTDTHIGKTEKECRNIRRAFQFFEKQKIDLLVHLGDIADYHYTSGYKIARRYINEIFVRHKPPELWIYANHDSLNRKGHPWEKETQEELQIPNNPYDKLVLKGIPFLVFPQAVDFKKQEKMIQQAVREFPGKPVFVLDHIPPAYTTGNSGVWGSTPRRKMLDKYPQVIQLSGHTHNSLRNERCIWQGNFTAVNCGTLMSWGGSLVGTAPVYKPCDEVMIVEIFREKIIFRCYSTSDGAEIRPDRPWTIPWPHNPAAAPYNPALRAKNSPPPQFDSSARITMQPDKTPFDKLTFTFPEAKHPEKCYRYLLTLKRQSPAGVWEPVTVRECFGNFWKRPYPEEVSLDFSAGFFEENGLYKLTIEPRNYYGGAGKPLEYEFRAPRPRQGKVIFECRNPMQELPYMTGLDKGEAVKHEGDFYLHPGSNTRLVFPEQIWTGGRGTKFRFIIDMAFDQPENSSWTVVLRNPVPLKNAHARISTPHRSSNQRIVVDFVKKNRKFNYYWLIREGLPGKVAFKYVRIEKL